MQSLAIDYLPDVKTITTPLLFEGQQAAEGSIHYSIKRFLKPIGWMGDERTQVHYHYEAGNAVKSRLELHFCLKGNTYCKSLQADCNGCKAHQSVNCEERTETVDFVSFSFTSSALSLVNQSGKGKTFSDRLLRFQHNTGYTRALTLCGKTRVLMDGLLNHSYTGALQAVFVNAQAQLLLLQTLEKVEEAELSTLNCKFLSNMADRDKVLKAKDILLEQISEPITIKQLSRRVAMNECYLKRGFKEMFGTTIFDFYQNQRMEHARYLLYEKSLSVTEVSLMLGYSSISHFSTAFKKQTGLKPCELLLRT